MSLFSKQVVYCRNCGTRFKTNFNKYQGEVCSYECKDHLAWKKTLSVMGKEYQPIPDSACVNKEKYGTWQAWRECE